VQAILQPSGGGPTIPRMHLSLLICSDDRCTDELEAAGSLEEVEAIACDCGCVMQVVSVSDVEFEESAPGHGLARAA
jgi:hypothetical protein